MFSIRFNALGRQTLALSSTCNISEIFLAASLHTSRPRRDQSYYDSLGVPSSSTQGDIKTAYYKLSMQFHPDKNKGCNVAAKKFREITQAYEVLGNYRLRKLYDKGIIQKTSPEHSQPPPASAVNIEPDIEDSAETRFYKSRFKKTRVMDTTGRTPIYNFDEWSRAHYGNTFNRRQEVKAKYENELKKRQDFAMALKMEIFIFGLVIIGTLLYMIVSEAAYDYPKPKVFPRKTETEIEPNLVVTETEIKPQPNDLVPTTDE